MTITIRSYRRHQLFLCFRPEKKYREYGEDRWFFFVRRERKHEGGNRPNRATLGNGHWNATGSPRLIRAGGAQVGRVRTLVFYEASRSKKKQKNREEAGKASKGAKTEWTMYEYESLEPEEEFVATCVDGNARMDAIVLCTIQHGEAGKIGETKKRTINRKAKGKGQEAGGRKRRKRTSEPQEGGHARRTPTETEALVQDQASTGAANFTVDPDDDMEASYFSFSNTSPPALPPPPPQETMMAAAAGGDNYISVHPSTAAMTSWQFQFPAVPLVHEHPGGNYYSIMAPNTTWMDLHFASATDPPPPLEDLSTASWIHAPLRRHNEAKIAPSVSVHPNGFGPGISSSSYGFAGGDTHRLSTGTGHHELSRLSLPSHPSYGVGSAQGSADSMALLTWVPAEASTAASPHPITHSLLSGSSKATNGVPVNQLATFAMDG
ncbi:hypothetical protein C2845_PM02G25130 [Panicum miliaceum]|uniref:NAC domain-containing protein n=1 Tax=Panicum miliaceum TaxID=4540 RepID=A0A3L6SEL8_PANMI|nr:hypothetical protein C2845_PM02G25130 [Panicum miliaceum]